LIKEVICLKVFTHGSVLNFQESAREMFLIDFQGMLKRYQQESDKVLFGTIDLGKEEICVMGHVQEALLNEENAACYFRFNRADGDEETLLKDVHSLHLTHDAIFDIVDDEKGTVRYQALFMTFLAEEEETYFFAAEEKVKESLAYVIDFWQRVNEVGRDANFSVVGCRAKAFCR
jgi:hypothetical protein